MAETGRTGTVPLRGRCAGARPVLTGVVQLFSEVADGSLTVPGAQAEVFDIAAQAIRDVEDRCGVDPGLGMDVLHQRKPLQHHRDSA